MSNVWVELADGSRIQYFQLDDYRAGRVGDGGWPTRDGSGDPCPRRSIDERIVDAQGLLPHQERRFFPPW